MTLHMHFPKRRYTVLPSPPDKRDHVKSLAATPLTLPTSATLATTTNGWLPPVRDQGQTGSCTAYSTTYGRAFQYYQHRAQYEEFSTTWFYWNERLREGTTDQDSGAYVRDAMKVLRKKGCCPNAVVPDGSLSVTTQPPPTGDPAAFPYRTTEYWQLRDLPTIKMELSLGNPVVLAVLVWPSFEQPTQGTINAPTAMELTQQPLGGHAICAYAYNDDARYAGGGYVTFRNSWGTDWGLSGDARLAYAYFSSPAFMEAWSWV